MIKDNIQSVLWTVYKKKGWEGLYQCSWELMYHCEDNAKFQEYRQMKGEIAEVVLDCGLRELQKVIKPSVVLKGLCIPVRSSKNATTEMDLVFVTERKIYLFECKSYKNKPVITGECMLGDNMDVAGQNKYHLKALHEYIGGICKKNRGTPYKLVLFEMSTEGVDDQRTEEMKKRIPVFNSKTFIKGILDDYQNSPEGVWNVKELIEVLEPLADNSGDVFKKHLNRMIHKKGG